MTTYSAEAIRSAIKGVMEGSIGVIRTVPVGTFKYGTFGGQPNAATKAKTSDPTYQHRFDFRVGGQRMHSATPISAKSSYKTVAMPVTIDITTRLLSTPLEERRDQQRSLIENNAQLALMAMEYPGNLTLDSDGNSTGIVSGILMGSVGSGHPAFEVVSEDWDGLIHRSRIVGAVVLVIDQRVSA